MRKNKENNRKHIQKNENTYGNEYDVNDRNKDQMSGYGIWVIYCM